MLDRQPQRRSVNTFRPLLRLAKQKARVCVTPTPSSTFSSSPLRAFEPAELAGAEAEHGKLHYKYKMHSVLRSPWEIATNPVLLDAVEAILGPNILLYNTCYIVKEAGATSHVSWHQDLT